MEKLRLRVFHLPDDFALRLSNRASSIGISVADLAHQYIDEYMAKQKLVYIGQDSKQVLRSYYLTQEQDEALRGIAFKFQTTKGMIFRSAIAQGLGF